MALRVISVSYAYVPFAVLSSYRYSLSVIENAYSSLSYVYVTLDDPSPFIVIFCTSGLTNPVFGFNGASIVEPVVPVPIYTSSSYPSFNLAYLFITVYVVLSFAVYIGLILILSAPTVIVICFVSSPLLHPAKSYPSLSIAFIVISVPYGYVPLLFSSTYSLSSIVNVYVFLVY